MIKIKKLHALLSYKKGCFNSEALRTFTATANLK